MENNITSIEGQINVTQSEGIQSPNDNQEMIPKTMEELQILLQKEGDKRVSQAQKKWQEKQAEIVEAEKAEAARLAKMSAAEREKVQYEKEKAEFLAERAKMERERLVNQTEKELVLKGLDEGFAKYVIAETNEAILENINTLKDLFDRAVNEAVKSKVATPSPKRGTSTVSNKSGLMDVINSKRVRR